MNTIPASPIAQPTPSVAVPTDLFDILTHSLGMTDSNFNTEPYRNRFAASFDSDDYRRCERLVLMGLMRKGQSLGYGDYFYVTEQGIDTARIAFEKKIGGGV